MKKIISLGLIVCLLAMSSINTINFSNSIYKPMIGVVSDENIQVLNAGEKGTFEVKIRNVSYVQAQRIKIGIAGDHPFRSDVRNLNKNLSFLNPNREETITFDVVVSPTAESRIYEFDLVFEYQNFDEEIFTETQKVLVQIRNNNVEPIITVAGSRSDNHVIRTGEESVLVVHLKNNGTINASDMRVKVSGFSNEGVLLNREADTKVINELKAGDSEMIFYNIVAGRDITTGTYPITVSLTYNDAFGKRYEKTHVLYLALEGKEAVSASIKLENLLQPSSVMPNKDFEVSVDIVNTSKTVATNAEVNFEYGTEFIAKSSSKAVIRNLAPGQKETVVFKMMAKTETPMESYHNYINVTYVPSASPQDTPGQVQEYVGIFVEGQKEEHEGSRPKLIVDNYQYGGDNVLAGENFYLDLFIKNTSSSEGTRNIKVTLSSEDNVFTPVDSSSSFFIASIGPNQVYQHRVELKTKIDANVKIYALTTKMEYEDSRGNAYDSKNNPFEESEVLSVAVAQPVRLETADLVVPFEVMAGQPFYLEQEFYNMGKSTMYNMMVRLEGVQTNEGSYFVGNFDAGRSEYFSAQVFANEPGMVEGKLIYSFEDALGSVTIIEQPFGFNVSEPYMPDFDGDYNDPIWDDMNGDVSGGFNWMWLLGLGLVAMSGAIVFLRKRKKRRIAKELEELDE